MPAQPIFVATADDIIEQIMIQCYLFEARDGQRDQAWQKAEACLERLLRNGLPYQKHRDTLLLDPYAANNALKSRQHDRVDDAWHDWQRTTRRNATSLDPQTQQYRLTLHREWHSYHLTPGRPTVLRMPLPVRNCLPESVQVRLLQPDNLQPDIRITPGRVELRIDCSTLSGPVIAELTVDFLGGDVGDSMFAASRLEATAAPEEQLWLRNREGLIQWTPSVESLASQLVAGSHDTRDYAHAIWRWLMQHLRFGDVHRSELDANDPLGGLLQSSVADCVLGSSLLVALCRSRGIPARLLTGYLLHPANLGPHSWAEVRLAPDLWVPFDFGSWCYCAGDPDDAEFGNFFRGRVDARFIAEVAPRDFTGWGSAPPPEHWYRLEKLRGHRIEHTLHCLPDGALFRRDLLDLQVLATTNI